MLQHKDDCMFLQIEAAANRGEGFPEPEEDACTCGAFSNLEDFRDGKGWLDTERFGFKNSDEVWANISQTPNHPVWVKGKINGMLVSHGGEALYEHNIDMLLEFKWKGKTVVERVYRPQLSKTDPTRKEEEQITQGRLF